MPGSVASGTPCSLIDNVCFEWTINKTIDPACHVRKNSYDFVCHKIMNFL